MGIYGGYIGLATETGTLPRLSALVTFNFPISMVGAELRLRLVVNGRDALFDASLQIPPPAHGGLETKHTAGRSLLNVPVLALGVPIASGSFFQILADVGDFSYASHPLDVVSAPSVAAGLL